MLVKLSSSCHTVIKLLWSFEKSVVMLSYHQSLKYFVLFVRRFSCAPWGARTRSSASHWQIMQEIIFGLAQWMACILSLRACLRKQINQTQSLDFGPLLSVPGPRPEHTRMWENGRPRSGCGSLSGGSSNGSRNPSPAHSTSQRKTRSPWNLRKFHTKKKASAQWRGKTF